MFHERASGKLYRNSLGQSVPKGELACDKGGRLSMSHFTVFSTALPLSAFSGTSIIVVTGIISLRKCSSRVSLTL